MSRRQQQRDKRLQRRASLAKASDPVYTESFWRANLRRITAAALAPFGFTIMLIVLNGASRVPWALAKLMYLIVAIFIVCGVVGALLMRHWHKEHKLLQAATKAGFLDDQAQTTLKALE